MHALQNCIRLKLYTDSIYTWPALKGCAGVGWGRHPPIHQVVGKILNPSRQNMDLDGKKKYLSDTD